ncbi:MAG: polyphosphate kinase 1, partial [Bdellovibrionales bacterium]|nr:polyphosphate kinase 1 [Bdellovibrionales bacterium]
DLLEMIEEEVKQRRFAEVVRLELGPKPDPWLQQFLLDELELQESECYEYAFGLEYKDLSAIASLNRPPLKYKPWLPAIPAPLMDEENSIFNIIRSSDLLVHHPYESFSSSVERFISTAAQDSSVVAIKMTLYRTSDSSTLLPSLIRAAESGKQVVVLIELKARFDEEKNIQWAQMLEKAGAHVVYGIVGLKTHGKLCLVVRQEKEEYRTYAHIGTGNYHPQTARLYTDFGLFTARPEITSEIVEVFHYLTGRSLKTDYQNIYVAPINMKTGFLQRIETEIKNAQSKKPSGIVAKMNSLEDTDIIDALYKASQAGVPIQLIVRGFSCLRAQVAGLSENIDVISVIGPLLEHSRVFCFRNGQVDPIDSKIFIGSADWMSRNLLRRVEVVVPILDRGNREKIWESLQVLLNDQVLTWDLKANGDYSLRHPKSDKDLGAHDLLIEKIRQRSSPFPPPL